MDDPTPSPPPPKPPTRRKRFRAVPVFGTLVILVVAAMAGAAAWLTSERGLTWLVAQVVERSEGAIEIDGARGTLADRVQFDRIVYRDEGLVATLTDVSARPMLRALLARRLRFEELNVGRVVIEQAASEDEPATPPDSLTLPIDITVDRAHIGAIDWRSGDASYTLERLALAYASRGGEHRFRDFEVTGPGGRLSGEGTVAMDKPFPTVAQLTLEITDPAFAGRVDARVEGTFDALVVSGTSSVAGVPATARVTVAPFAAQPVVEGHVDAKDVDLAKLRDGLPATRLHVVVDAKPSPGGFSGQARATNAAPGAVDTDRVPLTDARTDFALSGVDLELRNLAATLEGGATASGNGRIDIDTFHQRWNLVIARLDLRRLHTALASTNLGGRVEADVTGDVQRVTADVSQDDIRLAFDATYDGKAVVAERLLAQARNGTLEGSARIVLDGDRPFVADLRARGFDPSRFGDFPAGTIDGTIAAKGSAAGEPFANADVRVANGSRLAGLPLQGRVHGRFAQRDVRELSADASLGGTRVQANGAIGRPGDRMTFEVASRRLEELESLLPGTVGPLSGRVDASVNYETLARGIRVSVDARGNGVRHGDRRVQAVMLVGRATHTAPIDAFAIESLEDVSFVVQARDVATPEGTLERLRAAIDGSVAAHTIVLSARREGIDIDARIAAEASDATSPTWRWRGRVESLVAKGLPAIDRAALASPASFDIAAERMAVDAFRITGDGAVLDVERVRYAAGALDTRGRFASLPVAPLLKLAGQGERFPTDLRLRGSWDIESQRGWRGTVDVARESGDLFIDDPALSNGSRISLGISDLTLRASFDGGRLSGQGELRAALNGTASTRFELVAPSGAVHPFEDASRIDATLRAQLPSLAALQPWIGTTARVQGRASADVAVTGTLGSPQVTGTVLGENLRVDMPQHGVALRDGRLRVVSGRNGITLEELVFTAGEGRFTASGIVGSADGTRASRIEWRAENFRALNRPDRRLVVDGNGTLAFNDGRIVLRGKVSADEGTVEYRASDDTKLADDIVVVGRERPTRTAEASGGGAPIDLDLDIALGRNLRFAAEGLEARLGGRVSLTSTGGGPVQAKGVIRIVDGTYYAFGQRLDIDRGRVIFDGPVTNPSLDIVALRKKLPVEAGVEIVGTVRAPLVRLTSNPPVPDNEKLAWLITGGPPGNESAQQSTAIAAAAAALTGPNNKPFTQKLAQRIGLDDISVANRGGSVSSSDPLAGQVVSLGKRISDRVYVAYEQGLSLANTAVRLEYVLTRYLTVAAFTGTNSGVALNYRRSWR